VSLELPCFTIDLSGDGPRVRARRGGLFRPGELTELTGIERGRPSWPVERYIPLVDGRWVVGRRAGDVDVWRMVDQAAVQRVGHPAWLWTSDDWLDPDRADEDDAGPVPPHHPLRSLLKRAAPAADRRHLVKALGGIVASLRARKAVAVLVSEDSLGHTSQPVQALALALLTALPQAWRHALRLSVGEVEVRAGEWDLVFTPEAPPDYRVIDLADPVDEGDDLVAYYLRNRLMADDPEAVEAAAHLAATDASDDPWGDAVALRLREGIEGVSTVEPEWLTTEPERAVRALTARLRAGAELDDELMAALVDVTVATADPRPWRALVKRPANRRARATGALLRRAHDLRPNAELIRVLAEIYPPGAPLDPWLSVLLGWLHAGSSPQGVVQAVATTLQTWPLTATRATRSSVWSEVVYALVAQGLDDEAMDALVSPVARQLALDGSSRALAANWSIVPASFRDHERLQRLVELFAEAPDGPEATADLLQHVHGQPDEGRTILTAWVQNRRDPDPDDQLFRKVRDTPLLDAWLVAALDGEDLLVASDRLEAWSRDEDDPLWVAAEQVHTRIEGLGPRDRFAALVGMRPGLLALEPKARRLFADAVDHLSYPDADVAEAARYLAEVEYGSALWPWVVVTASAPGRIDDATIDDTVVSFCADPPTTDLELRGALGSVRAVGRSGAWEPLELARWIVRISLAGGDPAKITPRLALALLEGVTSQPDALPQLIAITQPLLELPGEHPALVAFITYLLPTTFPEGVPRLYRAAIDPSEVPPALRSTWSELVNGRC